MTTPNLSLGRNAAWLDRRYAKCKKCSGRLRAVVNGKDFWIICDACEIAALAPSNLHSLIEDSLLKCH